MLPRARTDKLSIRELAEESMVYDAAREQTHCLNKTAAFIWRHCDGQRTVADLAALVSTELQLPRAEAVVELALQQLGRRHLLAETPRSVSDLERLSRRDALKKLAVAAAALPLVMTLSARRLRASAFVNGSQSCPAGFTPCGPGGLLQLCCNSQEQCENGRCVLKAPPPPLEQIDPA